MTRFSLTLILTLILASCEKAVTFDLDEVEPKLVVEATIENDQPPIVILSKSLKFFSDISPSILAASVVKNAEVYVSNGTLTHRLIRYSVPIGNDTLYYYSSNPSDPTSFEGELNTQYSLRILVDGTEYTATTTIPNITKRIDSIFWKPAPGSNSAGKAVIMVKVTDPPGYGDYVRYFTQRNSEPMYPAINSVFDDQIIDGTTYEVEAERGVDRNADLEEGYTFFDRGDTVVFKLSNIDKATFEFWRTMEFSYASIGNPFSTPTRVLSNISNNALGYFGGYASQFRSIWIPR
jgi:hypothetical protein